MKKSLCSVAILLLLLWKPALSLEGASNGLTLWANVLLPTLLPFMLCSGAVTASGGIPLLTAPFRPVLSLLGLSREGCYTLLTGLVCGYPMGAKTCSDLLARGMLSLREARVLLAISNHPSPMFLLGYVMAGLEEICPPALFLLAVYLPVLPAALLAGRIYGLSAGRMPREAARRSSLPEPSGFSFDRDFMGCLETMARIGGYVLVFSVLSVYVRELSPFSPGLSCCLLAVTEITTGVQAMKQTFQGPALAAALVFFSCLGGMSGIFQTKSVLSQEKNAGLSIRHYVLWKFIHAGLACLFLTAALKLPPALLPAAALLR